MTQMVNRKKKLKICRQYFPVVRIKEKIDSSYIEQQILRGETKGYYTYEEANFVLQNFISQRFMCADSLIHYHFVFCPRYRRKIFNIPGLEERFKDLTKASCTALNIDILAMECHIDHVHLFLSCPPTMSPSDIMHQIKGASSFVLREEFRELAKMPSLWTRSFFVSTAGIVSSETIRHYVDTQKTRY